MKHLRQRRIHGLGWRPDTPDQRDKKFQPARLAPYPQSKDWRQDLNGYPPAYAQLQVGSCTGNACAGAAHIRRMILGMPPLGPSATPSRLAIYYGERQIEGTIAYDSGAEIRDGFKVMATQGVADESLWPYDPSELTAQPSPAYYTEAAKHTVTQYMAVGQDQDSICGVVAAGYPVAFGFSVYDSFMSDALATSGMCPMPGPDEQLDGGHAVLIVGYSVSARLYIVRNSWGVDWGLQGHFLMPFDYAHDPDLASDFWCVELEAA